jgi:serum/glucocorticoid-regulated kinase 2
VRFSTKLIKFNEYSKAQERTFAITTKAIYNLKSKSTDYSEMQRRVDLSNVVGVSYSRSSDEFVLHVPNEYDYRFASPLKPAIVTELRSCHDANLAPGTHGLYLWEFNEVTLGTYVTTKADKKKNISRIPHVSKAINYQSSPAGSAEETKNREQRSRTLFAANEAAAATASLDDFAMVKVLGRGSFGKVMLVRKKDSGEYFAMKSLRKDALLERDQVEHTRTERTIMQHINHPYLVRLEFAFSSEDKIFFVMAFMKGGELFFHLKEAKKFPENQARFYAAQIALGLSHLHEKNIVYRDLKPENVLMDEFGNVHLTDFGMAKLLPPNSTTMSFVGTPEYLAPEIITGRGHGLTADWWSFGILIYEMMVGIPPFYNQNVQLMYELIQHGDLKFPQRNPLSAPAVDLIQRLLERNPDRRLGARGPQEVLQHVFFAGINWEDLLAKRVQAPFVPTVASESSTENFESEFTEEEPINSMVPEHKLRYVRQHQDAFSDF